MGLVCSIPPISLGEHALLRMLQAEMRGQRMRHAEPARVVGLRYTISSDMHRDTMAVLRLALDDPDSPLAGREFEVCWEGLAMSHSEGYFGIVEHHDHWPLQMPSKPEVCGCKEGNLHVEVCMHKRTPAAGKQSSCL